MERKTGTLLSAAILAAATLGIVGSAHAAANIDGTLTPGEGYGATPLATQVNVSTSLSADAGGGGGVANEASGTTGQPITQLSNVYAFVDNSTPSAPILDLFVGGSLGQVSGANDTHIELALETTSGGVSSLTGQNLPGSLPKVQFQGFAPNVLLTLTPFAPGAATGTAANGNISFKNLTTPSAAGVSINSGRGVTGSANNPNTEVGLAVNNADSEMAIGSAGEPSFGSVTTGTEYSIPLDTLVDSNGNSASTGYTGGNIEAFLFPVVGNYGRTDNQILAPFDYGTDPNGSDYTYIDVSNGIGGTGSNDPNATGGRQFVSAVYPIDMSAANPGGNQFFTIAVPEPASMSVLALAGMGLISRRRARKA